MAISKKLIISYALMFVAFGLISILAAIYPIGISIVTHVLFPIAAMLVFGMLTRFGYIKLHTLILGRVLIILAAMGWGDLVIHHVCLLLLQFNMLEAIILDVLKKHTLNATSGILLLISSFYLTLRWTGSLAVVENENYLLWIIAYTIWNANFTSLQLSGYFFAHHFLILLVPIISCIVLFDFSYWLMFRETSLLLGMAGLTCFKEYRFRIEGQQPFRLWFENIQIFIHNQQNQLLLLSVIAISILVQLIIFFDV